MFNKQQFYLLWDIDSLHYASQVAHKYNIPIKHTLQWVRERHVKTMHRSPHRNMFNKHPRVQVTRKTRTKRTSIT